jgi:hypothetical protein
VQLTPHVESINVQSRCRQPRSLSIIRGSRQSVKYGPQPFVESTLDLDSAKNSARPPSTSDDVKRFSKIIENDSRSHRTPGSSRRRARNGPCSLGGGQAWRVRPAASSGDLKELERPLVGHLQNRFLIVDSCRLRQIVKKATAVFVLQGHLTPLFQPACVYERTCFGQIVQRQTALPRT